LAAPVPERKIPVDLIRTLAIVLVIVLHASIEPQPPVLDLSLNGVYRWWTVNIFDSISRSCIPLFIMLSGALLLTIEKTSESMKVFFKKRWNRIGLPFIFWGIIYFSWTFYINKGDLGLDDIYQGIQIGPYYHFWFIYLLVGLYLITPFLRVAVSYSERRVMGFFLVLWFVGTAIVPLADLLFESFQLSGDVFMMINWVGYYLLGAYLLKVDVKKTYLYILLFLGFLWTIVGTYYATLLIGGQASYFFYDYLAINVIITSFALFLILLNISPTRLQQTPNALKWLVHKIGQNSLPIFLIHVIILESLQKGCFGFTVSINTITPAIEIPLITVITLFASLAIVLALKKVPYLKRLIG
jgi:surface polysaccharide O-acyltransferase-like enzyme